MKCPKCKSGFLLISSDTGEFTCSECEYTGNISIDEKTKIAENSLPAGQILLEG
jgi:uncharacterized Zn finger protein (UPF0148 family)